MTASTIPSPAGVARQTRSGRFLGFAPIVRKDTGEWAHSKRPWVILVVTSLFMGLAAANGAITSWIIANVPEGAASGKEVSLVPIDNFLMAIGAQFFVIVAVFASMSLLVAERERGTLSWVASKPVSRGAIWTAKWAAAVAVVAIVAGIVPLLVTFGVVWALYGLAPVGALAFAAIGSIASVAFVIAVVLTASTFISNQAAVAAIGIAAYFLPTMLAGLLPFDVSAFLPSSLMTWAVGLGLGMDVGFVTPISWAIAMVALVSLATWRMERLEL